jgi:hypothetical protein
MGKRRRIKCFLCERDPEAYEKLATAVASHHEPKQNFEIETHSQARPEESLRVGKRQIPHDSCTQYLYDFRVIPKHSRNC